MQTDSTSRAQHALHFSEQDFRLIVDSIPALVYTMTPACELEYVNQQVLDYFGRTPEELKDWDKVGAVHPADLPAVYASLRRTVEFGEPHEVQQRLRRADGVYRWFQPRAFALRDADGRILRWYAVLTDIEDLKRAEQAVRASEADFRQIVNSIPGFVATARADGEIEFVSQPILDYTGWTLEQSRNWHPLVHPDDLHLVLSSWRHSIETGIPWESEHRLRRADGAYRWFHHRGVARRDTEGHVIRWYILLSDIDERKHAEDALRSTQSRLSRATQIATVGELAASIAHEVNQPLAAVVANGHACLRWLSAQPPNLAQAREAAERVVRDGKDAGEVVRRVRALFKRAVIDIAGLDLNEVIREVLHLLQSEIAKKRAVVETDLEAGMPFVAGDRVQFQQLIVNLFLNGLGAMEPVLDRPKALVVRSKRDSPETILVKIRDYGVGLKDPDRIFEPFFTTKDNGMGMGLAICRTIVETHSGRIWATSEQAPGATFCFRLPVHAGPPPGFPKK